MLVLIGDAPEPEAQRFVRTVRADDAQLKSFETLFASGRPRCGQARDSQREFLFGPEGVSISARSRWCRSARRARWDCSRSAAPTATASIPA